MKKATFLVSLVVGAGLTFVAQAAELKADTVACISSKYLDKYQRLIEMGDEAFVADMMDRAQCYTNKRSIEATLLSEVGTNVRLELIDGHRVWTAKKNLAETAAE